jgi:hypothetical protein
MMVSRIAICLPRDETLDDAGIDDEGRGLARPHVGPRRTPCPRQAPVAPGESG